MHPEIPNGWRLTWLQVFHVPSASRPLEKHDHYEAIIERITGSDSSETWTRINGSGREWQDAIADAVNKIQG